MFEFFLYSHAPALALFLPYFDVNKDPNKEISPQGVALDDCQGVISRDFGSSRDLCFTSTLGSTLRSTLWSTVHQS